MANDFSGVLARLGLEQPQGKGLMSAMAGMPRPGGKPLVPTGNAMPKSKPVDRPGAFLIAAQQVAEDKSIDSEAVMDVMRQIAFHESNVQMSSEKGSRAFDPNVKQKGGGPGRGALQFEGNIGDNNAFDTAVDRAKRYFKTKEEPTPLWLKGLKDGDDATSLDLDKQMALALYDLRVKPGADISKVVKGDQSLEDFWLKSWWAGQSRNNPISPTTRKKKAAFRSSQNSLRGLR